MILSLTDILLSIITVFTIMNWAEHSQRWQNTKRIYGKYKYKIINYIKGNK